MRYRTEQLCPGLLSPGLWVQAPPRLPFREKDSVVVGGASVACPKHRDNNMGDPTAQLDPNADIIRPEYLQSSLSWIGNNMAGCDCKRVNETHLIATSEIQYPEAKLLTVRPCTYAHPCVVDEARVCAAISPHNTRRIRSMPSCRGTYCVTWLGSAGPAEKDSHSTSRAGHFRIPPLDARTISTEIGSGPKTGVSDGCRTGTAE